MGDPLDGYATQVAPPTPPPAPNLNDLGALQVAPPTTTPAQVAKPAVKTATAAVAPQQQIDPASGMPIQNDDETPANTGGASGSWDESLGEKISNKAHQLFTNPALAEASPELQIPVDAAKAVSKYLKSLGHTDAAKAVDAYAGAQEAVGDFEKSMSSPENLASMFALGRLQSMGRAGMAAERLVSAGFSADMLSKAYQNIPEVKTAIESGDWEKAARALAGEAGSLVMGGMAAHGAVEGGAGVKEEAKTEAPAQIEPNPNDDELREAGAVQITPPTKSVVDTTITPHDFLKAVGANDGGAMSSEQVELYRDMIRKGSDIQPPVIEYDENGNIIGGDGRHRAMAYALENTERMPVRVHRQLAPEVAEEPRYDLGELQPLRATQNRAAEEGGLHPDVPEKAAAAVQEGNGFTLHPTTGETPTTGFAVEAHTEGQTRLDHPATPQDIKDFYEKNKEQFDAHPELHIGGYGNELGVSAVVPEEGRARSLAERLDQKSIWDFENQREIPTGGTGETTQFPHYPLEQRMADVTGQETAAPEERYTHYSSEPIEGGVISGERRGEALAGSESARLQHENKVPGVYAYREGSEAESQIRSRSNKSTIVGNKNIADISGAQKEEFEAAHKEAFDRYKAEGDNDTMASQKALNDAEAHLRDAGYQGYEHVQGRPGTVFLFGDHPIEGAEGFKPSEGRAPSMATDVIKNLYRNAPDYVAPVAGKPLEIPADVLTDDATTESTLHHEAAHAVLGSLRGANAYQIISHLHPDAAAEGFAAAADFDYRDWGGDASGNISHEAATERINDMMDMMAAGGVSDEHFHGIPWGENQGIRGDVRMMEKLMTAAEVPEDDREAMIQAARDRATEVLTKPGVREIIQKHMNNRPEGLDESLHMDDEGIRAMTDEIKEHLNGNNTEDSRIHGSDNQENDARTEGQGEGEPLRTEQKRKVKAAPEEEEKAPLEVAPGETISTRVPTAKKAVEDSMTHGLVIDSKAIYDNPELAKKMANEVRNYPGLKVPEGASDTQVLDAFKEHLKDNIKYVYDQTTPEDREAHGGWYEGANKFAADRAAEHDLTTAQGAGVLASMSPQKDWDMNASLAKRTMDIWDNKQSTKTTPEMMARGKQLASAKNSKGEYTNEAVRKLLPKIEGKKLKDLNPDLQALWIRIYDEAHNPREFNKINPDGSEGPLRTTVDGDPERVAWGSLNEIGKSVKILGDGSRDNISKSLGFSHKIRNFFNNIIEPNSPRQDLTADTHAVAAAQLRPLSGNSPEVKKNFGGIMHAMSGTKGTYALYADAYREAAKDLDIPYARSLQSIVWEKIRSEFPADIKSKENLGGIDSIWKEYTDGQISKREAQDAIFTAARGYRDQAFGGGGDASDQGKLFEPSVSGESTSGNGGGRGGNSTSGSLGKRGGVSKGAIDALSFINMMKSQKGASRTGAALMGAGIAGAGAVAALSGGNKEEEPQAPQPRPEARTVAAEAPTDVHGLIKKASNDYGVSYAILHAQADQESKFNQDAVSPKGARGVMQLMPNTARSLNVDPNNMAENVDGGARLMSQLHHRFGSYDKALAAYDWSPDKVQDAIDTYGNDWLKHTPAETRNYVLRIMKNSR